MNTIDIDLFIEKLEEKTLADEIQWKKDVYSKSRYLDRSANYERIKDVFTNRSKNGDVVALGCFETRRYYSEDEYSFSDVYFLTITGPKFENPVRFIYDDEFSKLSQAQLGKLYRIIQLKTSDVANKIDSWFE